MSDTIALYVHWPFCKSKCPYCDFNSHVRESIAYDDWLAAYIKELAHFSPFLAGKTITSIFFGGGTPSLMPASLVENLLESCYKNARISTNVEITLEANPTSVEAEKLNDFRRAGINRISLGIQSLDPESLRFLGREHSADEALHAIEITRNLFARYSFDLIYARPGQDATAWENELSTALTYAGSHLSLYQLTIERGTPFYSAHQRKEFTMPEECLAAELYTLTDQLMSNAGLHAYEVSNYAKPGHACRHNLNYWEYRDYLGIGPGAHSRITLENDTKHALMMIHNPENWLSSVQDKGHGIQQNQALSSTETTEEFLMMGLRLYEGISQERCVQLLGKSLDIICTQEKLTPLIEEELVTYDQKYLRTTNKGMLVLNKIIAHLVA